MGQYTTDAKVRQLYPQLNDLTNLTLSQVEFYVSQAESEINGRIGMRYTLPFSSTPALIEAIATEYAFIKLMDRFYTAEAPGKNDWKEVRRKELKELIKDVADGKVTLVDSSYAIIGMSATSQVASDTSGYTPTFNHLDPTQQVIDVDRLDDEESAL